MQIFKNIDKETNELLLSNSVRIDYRKGEIIIKPQIYSKQILFLEKGIAKQFLEYKDKNLILRLLTTGDFLNTCSFLNNQPTTQFSVSAIEKCSVLAFNVDLFNNVIENNKELTKNISELQSSNLKIFYDRIISLTQKQIHGRIADLILHLANDVYKNNKFKTLLTRKDFGDFTGMSTESAIRVLREYHNDRIINIDGKTIEIMSLNLLRKLSEMG